jgi:futalosine hydrolase
MQVGIAGCFSEELFLGSVAIVGQDKCADEGVWENNQWRSVFSLGFADGNTVPYQTEWLVNNYLATSNPPTLPIVSAITVNEITTNPQRIAQYQSLYNPMLESLEGAALHYVGNLLHIPYLQIRGISNRIGERDKSHWQIQSALENSQRAAEAWINSCL